MRWKKLAIFSEAFAFLFFIDQRALPAKQGEEIAVHVHPHLWYKHKADNERDENDTFDDINAFEFLVYGHRHSKADDVDRNDGDKGK